MRVILVEDDPILGESIKEFLEENGLSVKWLQDERNIYYEDLGSYDVIILDLMLRFSKGEDIIVDIRRRADTPILILTAKRELKDKEVCFERGADDYLTKPFEPKELLLRLKAVSRRKPLHRILKLGNVTLDLDSEILYVDGREVKLSKTAWELLSFLARHRGEVVHKERIMNNVWGDKAVGDEVLRAYIKELRKVLPKGLIETYRGRGYRLRDEV